MEVYLSALLGNHDRLTDTPTNQPKDGHEGVTLPTKYEA